MEKINNNILVNKSGFSKKKGTIFTNVYLIILIFVISLIFIFIGIYYYIINVNSIKILGNSSYYGVDIANYEPIFQNTSNTVVDCINICTNDLTCD